MQVVSRSSLRTGASAIVHAVLAFILVSGPGCGRQGNNSNDHTPDTGVPSTPADGVGGLSADQSFVLVDDAADGEYVGIVKAYPHYQQVGPVPTFATNSKRYDVGSDGQISLADSSGLMGQTDDDTFEVTVHKNGYPSSVITITVRILNADSCRFVDPSAAYDGLGTRASPYNTMPLPGDGDIILFRRGTTMTFSYAVGADHLLFASYGTGALPVVRNSGAGTRLFTFAQGHNGLTIRDLRMTTQNPDLANGSNWVNNFLYANPGGGGWSNAVLTHCDMQYGAVGVTGAWDNADPFLGENFTFTWNDLTDTVQDAVFTARILGTTIIDRNYIDRVNMNWFFVGQTEAQSPGDAIQTDNQEFLYIRHNYIDRSLTGNKFCIIAGQPIYFDNDGSWTEITDNYFVPPLTGGPSIYQYFDRGLVARNYFLGGAYGVYNSAPESKVLFAYNVFDGQTDIAIRNSDTIAYNNVFYGVSNAILGVTETRNNIFYFTKAGQRAYQPNGDADSDYNLFNQEQESMFGSAGDSLSDVMSESNSLIGDPLFVDIENDDFRVDEGSLARGKGVDVGMMFDFFGNDVEAPPDIGICECTGTTPLSTARSATADRIDGAQITGQKS